MRFRKNKFPIQFPTHTTSDDDAMARGRARAGWMAKGYFGWMAYSPVTLLLFDDDDDEYTSSGVGLLLVYSGGWWCLGVLFEQAN